MNVVESIRIGERAVGMGRPCFIIAEAGVNHNGDLELAMRLVDAAARASADAVKFQTWTTQKLVTPTTRMADYQKRNLGVETSQFDMLKSLELTHDQFRELKAHAHRTGILFLSTPDEEDSADFLEVLGVGVFKIGSAEVTNLPFLRHVARKGKPLILSTGMSTLGEVEVAVRTIEETGNRQLAILHCVSAYPANPADCNLRAMQTLRAAFGYPVGFSDHTVGMEVAVAAVARDACVLEKHLTLDRAMAGPDHRASIDAETFAAMVKAIRAVESALGNGVKRPVPDERNTREVVRKCIVTTRVVGAGEVLAESDLALRRCSGGMSSADLASVIGRRAKQRLGCNCAITPEMLG